MGWLCRHASTLSSVIPRGGQLIRVAIQQIKPHNEASWSEYVAESNDSGALRLDEEGEGGEKDITRAGLDRLRSVLIVKDNVI